MVVVDANVLVHAVNLDAREHATARDWLDEALLGAEGVGLPWVCLLAFLRLVTHPRVMPTPQSTDAACGQIERWLAAPAAVPVAPTTRHATLVAGLLRDAGSGGNLVNDAHLAALALEHDAAVVSFDRDFARFPGVVHRLPGS